MTSIGGSAFSGCSGLTSVTIPNSVTSIGDYTFYGCSGLTSVTIPNSVTSIGNYAFRYCSRLTSVTIPNSVTSIGGYAFSNCSGLTSVTIPNSVTSIGNYAFRYCSSISSVIISCKDEADFWKYVQRDDIYSSFYSKVSTGAKHSVYINGEEYKPTSLVIPNSVTKIGGYAFYACSGLTSITIPNSVTSIGSYAFAYIDNLNKVYCYAKNVPSTSTDAFYRSYVTSATLYVPDGSQRYYKENSPWKDFEVLLPIVDVTSVKVLPASIEIEMGNKIVIEATVLPANASNNTIAWSSSDTNVATVDAATGEVTAISVGTATITATASNGMTGTCKVIVMEEGAIKTKNLIDGEDYYNGSLAQFEELTFTKPFSASAAGNWNAFYVPMSINVEDYADELDFAEIYAFCAMKDTNWDGVVDANDENFLYVNPVKTGCTKPNVPYMVRPKEAKTYVINSADNMLYPKANGKVEFSTSHDNFTVTGLNEAFTVTAGDNNYYVSASGSLNYRTTGSTTVKANRWVMHRESKEYGGGSSSTSSAKESYRIVAIGEDIDEATAIELIKMQSAGKIASNGVYTLDGRKVNSEKTLPAGIYIKNGKKILNK